MGAVAADRVLLPIPPRGHDPKRTSAPAERQGIATRPVLREAIYLDQALGPYPAGTPRIGPRPFTTAVDIGRLIEGLDAGARDVR